MGNVGNTPDSTGYGAVDYEYRIGKYEVTAGQYCEFLNAVAKTDTYGLYNTEMDGNAYASCKIQRSGSSGGYTYTVAP
ncbi:MAG TPA: PEP-CTERM sorting domain-containing protein, partial [Phycisphaerae bacterium]|nr:PEP-CTERM sorting domain-containing protein [Phycisphaerae bacterium]